MEPWELAARFPTTRDGTWTAPTNREALINSIQNPSYVMGIGSGTWTVLGFTDKGMVSGMGKRSKAEALASFVFACKEAGASVP